MGKVTVRAGAPRVPVETTVRRVGNSLGVILPRETLRRLGLTAGDEIRLELEDPHAVARQARVLAVRGALAGLAELEADAVEAGLAGLDADEQADLEAPLEGIDVAPPTRVWDGGPESRDEHDPGRGHDDHSRAPGSRNAARRRASGRRGGRS